MLALTGHYATPNLKHFYQLFCSLCFKSWTKVKLKNIISLKERKKKTEELGVFLPSKVARLSYASQQKFQAKSASPRRSKFWSVWSISFLQFFSGAMCLFHMEVSDGV